MPLGIPIGMIVGNNTKYCKGRKYLKQNKVDNVENKIKEIDKELELIKIRIDEIRVQLSNLFDEQKTNNDNIYLLESKIKSLKDFRNSVIDKYLSNNQEFEDFVEKESTLNKQKKLNKN